MLHQRKRLVERGKTMTELKTTSIMLTVEQYDRLRQESFDSRKSQSEIIREALKKYWNKEESQMVNLQDLEKLSYEEGKELLLQAGYHQDETTQEKREDGTIVCDEYYTLFDKEDNPIHVVSFVSYFQDVPGDEPVPIFTWHWGEA